MLTRMVHFLKHYCRCLDSTMSFFLFWLWAFSFPFKLFLSRYWILFPIFFHQLQIVRRILQIFVSFKVLWKLQRPVNIFFYVLRRLHSLKRNLFLLFLWRIVFFPHFLFFICTLVCIESFWSFKIVLNKSDSFGWLGPLKFFASIAISQNFII